MSNMHDINMDSISERDSDPGLRFLAPSFRGIFNKPKTSGPAPRARVFKPRMPPKPLHGPPLQANLWWPRDPNGPNMEPSSADGKRAPNASGIWSENISGFYMTNRFPSIPGLAAVVSGSKMAEFCRKVGETTFAKRELANADRERDPMRREWTNIAKIWRDEDTMIRAGCHRSMRDEGLHCDPIGSTRTPFHPASYPFPWPLLPFSSEPYKLQQLIPFHLLPEKLVVHDPFHTLQASEDSFQHASEAKKREWPVQHEKTHVYHLQLYSTAAESVRRKRAEIAEMPRDPVKIFEFVDSEVEPGSNASRFHYFDSSSELPADLNALVPIAITVPPSPSPASSTPLAHLYLSPARTVGQGNHSFVYSAEWELPRSIFVDWDICRECVKEEGEKLYMQRLERLEPKDLLSHEVHVENVPWYRPDVDLEPCNHRLGDWNEDSDEDSDEQMSLSSSASTRPKPPPNPPTALVSVIAKLSIPGDTHLARETYNYERFPQWMSEHWSGLTYAYPVKQPTRCGAIVPSWYGYYVPEEKDDTYLSPIMLIEDCGKPIDVDKLEEQDKYECAALLTRFHFNGWIHHSFAPRNIVMSYGDHTLDPHERKERVDEAKALRKLGIPEINQEDFLIDTQRRFRLIDFGRSVWVGDYMSKEIQVDVRASGRELGRAHAMETGDRDLEAWDKWDRMRFGEKNYIGSILELGAVI